MSENNYKPGDKVRIKSLDWYNQMLANKDKRAYRTPSSGCELIGVWCGNRIFKNDMIKFCGQVMTIKAIENEYYVMHEDTSGYWYCDEMIEGLVEEETKNWADTSIPDGPYTVTYDSPYEKKVLEDLDKCSFIKQIKVDFNDYATWADLKDLIVFIYDPYNKTTNKNSRKSNECSHKFLAISYFSNALCDWCRSLYD